LAPDPLTPARRLAFPPVVQAPPPATKPARSLSQFSRVGSALFMASTTWTPIGRISISPGSTSRRYHGIHRSRLNVPARFGRIRAPNCRSASGFHRRLRLAYEHAAEIIHERGVEVHARCIWVKGSRRVSEPSRGLHWADHADRAPNWNRKSRRRSATGPQRRHRDAGDNGTATGNCNFAVAPAGHELLLAVAETLAPSFRQVTRPKRRASAWSGFSTA
jgi:hypothetical protein